MVKLQTTDDVRKLVEQIANQELDPKKLSKIQQQNCVEFLRYGLRYSYARIAQILKSTIPTVRKHLQQIHIGLAAHLQHGQIGEEIIGALFEQLRTNYEVATEKKDVSGMNKATELLKELAQDLGHISKAEQLVKHTGTVDILALARAAKKNRVKSD